MLKKQAGEKVETFRQTLQISDGIQTDSYKFPSQKIMDAQSSNSAPTLARGAFDPEFSNFG